MIRPEPLRAGLIGYGIGKVYAAALRCAEMYYAGLPKVELIAVATASAVSGRLAVAHHRRESDAGHAASQRQEHPEPAFLGRQDE